jgi:hypothetical protein
MKIYTGNFANVKRYKQESLFPVSIAISARYFSGALYRPLNPDKEFMMDTEPVYTPKFNAKLLALNANTVFSDIEKISNGSDVVLLCHEKEGDFCHRRLVASWLENNLGIKVPELGKMQKQEQLELFADLV